MYTPMRSLYGKIVMLSCGVAIGVSALVGAFAYVRVTDMALEAVEKEFSGKTRLLALRFKAAYDQMRNDAFVVSRTPPVQGLIRSVASDDKFDAADKSTADAWRRRLEMIFTSLMEERAHYTQMRYIGIADGGRELVRVNREAGGALRAVKPEGLQQKGGEDYFLEGIKLKKDGVYFSNVTYNRENGKIDDRLMPTVRAAIPVYSNKDNSLFGLIVVNADYPELLRTAYQGAATEYDSFVINQDGDYFRYAQATGESEFEFHGHYTKPAPDIIEKVAASHDAAFFFSNAGFIYYFTGVNINESRTPQFIGVALQAPKRQLLGRLYDVRRETLWLALGLIAASGALAALLARHFCRPLIKMTENIAAADSYKQELELPVHLKDEIGSLARAFRDMVNDLRHSDARSKAVWKAVLDSANDGIITINEYGMIEGCNPAAQKIFGYSYDEMLGKNVKMLTADAYRDKHDAYLANYRKTGEKKIIGIGRQVEGRRKDGSEFPLDLSVSEVNLPDLKLFTGIVRDVSAQKEAERERDKMIEKLRESNNDLDQFAYVASHDLKAPLRVIDNASRWLEEDLADLTEDSKENMQLLRNRVSRMERLLDDLLEYSRIGRKMNEEYEEIIDGATLADDVLSLLSLPEGFTVAVGEGFASLRCYRMPLQQILLNLASNAVKHHDKPNGTIAIDVAESDGKLVFSVKDNGPGIPPEFRTKIFEMFQTLKPRDRVEGSGMGLAIVKRHIMHAGGDIEVKSAAGEGSEFVFTWPAATPIIPENSDKKVA